MTSNKEIQDELSALSPTLAAIQRTNVFRVPDNYFNELPGNVLQLLQSDIVPSFNHIREQPMAVPEGYFDGLASDILGKIKAANVDSSEEEIAALSPTIAAIGNKNIFTVPEGYFENTISEAIKNIAPQARVVEMKKRSGLVRYMAAAAVTGIIGLSIFNLAGKKDKITDHPLTENTVFATAEKIVKENSFDTELSKLSDKDIEQYLKESGENVNAALVASATDEVNLPSAEEYIINDNTLDDFLNKINLNN